MRGECGTWFTASSATPRTHATVSGSGQEVFSRVLWDRPNIDIIPRTNSQPCQLSSQISQPACAPCIAVPGTVAVASPHPAPSTTAAAAVVAAAGTSALPVVTAGPAADSVGTGAPGGGHSHTPLVRAEVGTCTGGGAVAAPLAGCAIAAARGWARWSGSWTEFRSARARAVACNGMGHNFINAAHLFDRPVIHRFGVNSQINPQTFRADQLALSLSYP